MDANNKPIIPRALLQRMTSTMPSSTSLTGSTTQSFGQRKQINMNRKRVASYEQSRLGVQNYREAVGDQIGALQPTTQCETSQRVETGQNRPSAGFKEPPSRQYNPYS